MSLAAFAAASVVGCYQAVGAEVRMDLLIAVCGAEGKTLAVPAWRVGSGAYRLARIDGRTDLAPGRMGILEPVRPEWLDTVDLIVVPGLAFDECGGRLGHGGGHYDAMLAALWNGPVRVGAAFDFQVVGRVPTDRGDERMDAVVTETRCLRCGTRAVD
jgi:5-formyltetrahydrofolate cyclo-ligase